MGQWPSMGIDERGPSTVRLKDSEISWIIVCDVYSTLRPLFLFPSLVSRLVLGWASNVFVPVEFQSPPVTRCPLPLLVGVVRASGSYGDAALPCGRLGEHECYV